MVYARKIGRPPKHVQKDKPDMNSQIEHVIRTGGRVKKVKKVFDPSENNLPKKRVTSTSSERISKQYINENDQSEGGNGNSSLSKQNNRNNKLILKRTNEVKKKEIKVEELFCSICSKREKKASTLILCKDCNLKAHETCIKINFLDKQLMHSKWRCDNCKTCSICYETVEIGPMLTCSKCVKNYHYSCHVPRIIIKHIIKDWKCTRCLPQITSRQFKPSILKSRASSSTIIQASKPQTQSKKQTEIEKNNSDNNINIPEFSTNVLSKKEGETESEMDEDDLPINQIKIAKKLTKISYENDDVVPDVSLWSCEELANYIGINFPNESEILREQEIDGASLLLMTRMHVLKGLGLKLGPAIRLYNFIICLQTKKFDPYASWMY